MTYRKLKFALPILFLSTMFFMACSDDMQEQSFTEVENYTEEAMIELQRKAGCGKLGCFEFVFPVTFSFSNSEEYTVASYEEMREVIKAWKEENPDTREKPDFVYPIDVMTEDGEIVTVESKSDLKDLISTCVRKGKGPKGKKGFVNSCFEIVFPANIEAPDGNIVTVENRDDFKQLLREWAQMTPRPEKKPRFIFPVTVLLKETNEEVVLNNLDDMKQLREDCRG